MYLLGFDIGSSSVKATLLDAETGKVVASATSPAKEMEIIAVKPGCAEQRPQTWWDYALSDWLATLQSAFQAAISSKVAQRGYVNVSVKHLKIY